jgi:L-threonylcarbamoyladenylate synthase
MRILPAGEATSIAAAETALISGELIAIPTDTVYGLAALASNREACERLYTIKDRSLDTPTAIVFSRHTDLRIALPLMSSRAKAACDTLLPGPFTLIVVNGDELCPWLCGTRPEAIGVRIPEGALDLPPVAATSANEHGQPEVARLDLLTDSIADHVSIGLHSHELPAGGASTVIDLTAWEGGGEPVVLRDPGNHAESSLAVLAGL